jgi:membrane protease subunit HflK
LKLVSRLALVLVLVLVLAGAYVSMGFVQIEPDEQGVVLLLGRFVRTLEPGLRWHARWLEHVEKQRVTVTLEQEFGYRTVAPGPPPEYEDRPEEKRMLTGDANLADVEFVIQYRITDLAKYLFKVKDVPGVIRDVSQAAMREVVAKSPIDDVLTEVKGPIQDEARQRIQEVLDSYATGVLIQSVQLQDVEPPDPVKDAFADVASAEQDRESLILEAQGYADQVVPRARGEVQELLNQAQAYRETRVLVSRGEAKRFKAMLSEYERAPEVTRERLYLETLEAILPRMEKVIIEEGHSEKVLPYLPLGRKEVVR